MALAKGRDTVVIAVLVARQHTVGHLSTGRPLATAPGRFAGAVRLQQQPHHHHRMIRWPAAPVCALLHLQDLAQVELVDDIQQNSAKCRWGSNSSRSRFVRAKGAPQPSHLRGALTLHASSHASFRLTQGLELYAATSLVPCGRPSRRSLGKMPPPQGEREAAASKQTTDPEQAPSRRMAPWHNDAPADIRGGAALSPTGS